MANYPSNALDDGELTDPEIRRLVHEIVRERMRVVHEAHLTEYWVARQKAQRLQRPGDAEFPDYDPTELHRLRRVLIAEVRDEVLQFRRLDLTRPPPRFSEAAQHRVAPGNVPMPRRTGGP